MCGRYYIDKAIEKDIEQIVQNIDNGLIWEGMGDIHPTDTAPIIYRKGSMLCAAGMKWGLMGREKKLLINARAESVMERPTFSESVMNRRCIIPARQFYEWDREKQKVTFCYTGETAIYMAGFYRRYEDGFHFIIVTTAANDSMRPIHDRMPLILDEREIEPWICEDTKVGYFLKKTSPPLEHRQDFEQMSLF